MYFLLAVGLWIYIIYVFNRDKNAKKRSEAIHAERSGKAIKDHEDFVEKYSAPEERVSETYSEVFSNSDRVQSVRNRMETDVNIHPTADMLALALLSSECKMPRNVAYSGFRTIPEDKEDMQIERSFFKWYDNELLSNGFEYKLLFVPWARETTFKAGDLSVAIPAADNPEVTSGIYCWEPIRMFASGGTVITVR